MSDKGSFPVIPTAAEVRGWIGQLLRELKVARRLLTAARLADECRQTGKECPPLPPGIDDPPKATLEAWPLWRLLALVEDAERSIGPGSQTALVAKRILIERLGGTINPPKRKGSR